MTETIPNNLFASQQSTTINNNQPDQLLILNNYAAFATRIAALFTMVAWVLSWLAPELVRTSPEGSIFDLLFKRFANHQKSCRLAAVFFAVVHVACACAETGFLIEGWHSQRLSRLWFIPEGDMRTYTIVVGLPCIAFILLVLHSLVPSFRASHPRLTSVFVGLVISICYVENLCFEIGEWKVEPKRVAATVYYLVCSLFLAHAIGLYRIVSKKPTITRHTQQTTS